MLGSYAPSPDGSPYTKDFEPEESPSGMLARSGTYNVRSRVMDDDKEIYIGSFGSFCLDSDNLDAEITNFFSLRFLLGFHFG